MSLSFFACNKADQSATAPASTSIKSEKSTYVVAFKTEQPYADGRKATLEEANIAGLAGIDKGLFEVKGALGSDIGNVETVSEQEATVKLALTTSELEKVRTLKSVSWVVDAASLDVNGARFGSNENVPAVISAPVRVTNNPITKDISLDGDAPKTSIMPLPDIRLDSAGVVQSP